MQSCLGLYIEDNLIKYAKVSKKNENIKVESFGVKFYENLENAIKQIYEETYSTKLPISINSNDEWYNEIEVFSLLSKKDMDSAIKTEFENICYNIETNKNIFEEKYILTNANRNDEKIKAIHIAVPKTSIEQMKNQFLKYKIGCITPTSISIANLARRDRKGTNIIVNIEAKTTITRITNGIVSKIDVIDYGSQEILDKINKKENSFFKAYQICKNSTIYTETDSDLQYEENEYLEDIMPTLFKIVSEVRKNIDENLEKVDNVYITGTGAVINNIDIYFQEYFKNIHCELLKPSFINNNNSKINIKDYIEVNSAVAVALQAMQKDSGNINFKTESGFAQLSGILNSNISDISHLEITRALSEGFKKFNRQFDFLSTVCILSTILYLTGAYVINNLFENKIAEINKSIEDTNSRIALIQQYNSDFDTQSSKYTDIIKSINNINNTNSEDKKYRNTIPNLLNSIMSVIPQNVQLISITNDTDTHVSIKARSLEFQQLAYFKTKLNTEDILKNVVSDTGTSQAGYLIVTIEGDLP